MRNISICIDVLEDPVVVALTSLLWRKPRPCAPPVEEAPHLQESCDSRNLPVSVTPSPERAAEKGWMWVGSADPIPPEATADHQLDVRSRSPGTVGPAVASRPKPQLHLLSPTMKCISIFLFDTDSYEISFSAAD